MVFASSFLFDAVEAAPGSRIAHANKDHWEKAVRVLACCDVRWVVSAHTHASEIDICHAIFGRELT